MDTPKTAVPEGNPYPFRPIRFVADPAREISSVTRAAIVLSKNRATVVAMLKRSELEMWDGQRWVSGDAYKQLAVRDRNQNRATNERIAQSKNYFNVKQARDARMRRGEEKLEEHLKRVRKPCFAFDVPSVVYPSIAAAAEAYKIKYDTAKYWVRTGRFVLVKQK